MKELMVKASRSYRILVGEGLLEQAGGLCRTAAGGEQALVVTDSNVGPLYADKLIASLEGVGYRTHVFTFPAGEQSKTLDTVAAIYGQLAEKGMTRKDILVALGGGVTGDITGFAAATWLRGVNFVQIPTTLLSQVDSSVGGKTGVDVPEGKNLVGAFWQPALVLADTSTLNTLTPAIFADGMAEVVKTAAIRDAVLFEQLEQNNGIPFEKRAEILTRCIGIKRDVVERDEREQGERRLLNFGHTLGHALEKHYSYSGLSHGFAVAVGMSMITNVSERRGLTAAGTAARLDALLKNLGLPIADPAPLAAYLPAVSMDKKRAGSDIHLVLLSQTGDAFCHSLPVAELAEFLNGEGKT